ncbi:MAG: hypothetical protein H0Z40_12245 [Desulfotomaculum sp.]|nr:hypothetical protein [Desulfotomaculum sp.]
METNKALALLFCIVGAILMIISILYRKGYYQIPFMSKYSESQRKQYTDIGILQSLFLISYGIVIYFYLNSEYFRLIFITIFLLLQTSILLFKKNSIDWLTKRLDALSKVMATKKTKHDTVYWMFTLLIIAILILFSLPFWIFPNYPHNYIATIYLVGGILLYIRSFLFKNDEGRISLYDSGSGILLICIAIYSYFLLKTEGFTAMEGKMFAALVIIIFKRTPPKTGPL